MRIVHLAVILVVGSGLGGEESAGAGGPRVTFNRDVRPILADSCYRCHGPDGGNRKAGLRLDRKESATRILESGAIAVVPGDGESSELLARVADADPLVRMPPPGAGKPLGEAQVGILRRWIEAGAPWEEHWSLIPPKRPPIPPIRDRRSVRNPIDRFVMARLEDQAIQPSPEAGRIVLLRRISLDLTGLPPTPEEVDAFLADTGSDAYERRVERLLASPHYGERMAVWWLDLVRYADTVGYHSDVDRSIALYRDYVIQSFNNDLPFDRFTVEQLAGDLLPSPTAWQRIASAYNMLGMTTEEGGAQAREYLARYAADRVRNVSSVWMGATLGCAECHDHKYDPYSARDFYSLAAFFADLQQPGVGTPQPSVRLPTRVQAAEQSRLDAQVAEREAALASAGSAAAREKTRKAEELAEARKARAALERSIRKTIVAVSGPPRVTRVLHRGDWMDQTGEMVEPAVPHFLRPIELPPGRRASRLDLARWLSSPEHPQTARVVVNRLWKQFFGTGLSDTLEDLGVQGEWPSHPELLDWLAVELTENGWSIKRLIRLLVTSAAYRRSSQPREDLEANDPSNRLYARQTSFRLEAEFIRDGALAAGGLLVRTLGGESVRPYQPAGYWRFLNFPQREYAASTGPEQYRRGLYTHWQRTLLHPSLLAFDAPSREMCTAKRPISNTPQSALALLNDPSFVEAARVLAELAMRQGACPDGHRLDWVWRRVLGRAPAPEERTILLALLGRHRSEYAADLAEARRLVKVGQHAAEPTLDVVETAAWTSVARTILNLDETITRD